MSAPDILSRTIAFSGQTEIRGGFFRTLSQHRALSAVALLLLCLVAYLPGVLQLPPVDRSEVEFAHTSHEMLLEGRWLDPRYGDEVEPRRPIGTYWAQALSAWISGIDARWMPIYRLPSLLAVTLATLALFFLATPLVGSAPALLAAAFFAVSPLTVLVATLAIADGLALMCATVALLCLLRLYAGGETQPTLGIGLLFWASLGLATLVNALQVPVLAGVIIATLVAVDRDASWLKRIHAFAGIPLALFIGAPWLVVRVLQDGGVPYGDLDLFETIDALMGSQDMELRAFPGTFVVAPLLGFLPGLAVLADAAHRLWKRRTAKIPRFLLCWAITWIVFLELTSGKPATYSVQFVFPALALAVAGLILHSGATPRTLRWSLIPPLAVAIPLFLVLVLAPFAVAQEWPSLLVVMLAIIVAGLAALGGRASTLLNWSLLAVATFALYSATLLGFALPSISKAWPAQEIEHAVAACVEKPIWLVGFREPSGAFILGTDKHYPDPPKLISEPDRLHVIESRWIERFRAEAAKRKLEPVELSCFEAFNVMRGCPLTFTIFALDEPAPACRQAYRNTCARMTHQTRHNSKSCE